MSNKITKKIIEDASTIKSKTGSGFWENLVPTTTRTASSGNFLNNTVSGLTNRTAGASATATTPTSAVGNNYTGTGGSGSASSAPADNVTTEQQPVTTTPSFSADPMSNAAYKTASENYQAALQQGAPQYDPTYDNQMNALFEKMMNRDPFSYNLMEDPLYAQYRDQYTQQGQLAMMDTMGQAAALTGGYGNTYGQAVGQQQYNAYLQQLNDIVPELYDRAYAHYQNEGQDMLNQYGLLGDLRDTEYGRYQDAVNQYWNNISFLQGEEETAYNRGLAAEDRAYDIAQDNKSYLLDLMTNTGYVPSEAELAAAGMTPAEAQAWLTLWSGNNRGGGGRSSSTDDDELEMLDIKETGRTVSFENNLKTWEQVQGTDRNQMWDNYGEYVDNEIQMGVKNGKLNENEAIYLMDKYGLLEK